MKLWEDAIRIQLFGTEAYEFGLYCAIGAACAIAALCVACRHLKIPQAAALTTGLLCLLLGTVFSRITFCLLDFELGEMLPVSEWTRITTGGWALFGMIGGAILAAWIGARITKQKPLRMLDAVTLALPLMIAAERFGELHQNGFDTGRPMKEGTRMIGFLTFRDELESRIATFRLASILAFVLFVILVIYLFQKQRRDGEVWIRFMMLCGAGGVILESMRGDEFLIYSFVRLQQVLAAAMLIWGVILAVLRGKRAGKSLRAVTAVSLILAVGISIAIEFGFDRTQISHVLLYVIMITVLAIPVVLGFILLAGANKGQEAPYSSETAEA